MWLFGRSDLYSPGPLRRLGLPAAVAQAAGRMQANLERLSTRIPPPDSNGRYKALNPPFFPLLPMCEKSFLLERSCVNAFC